MTKPKIISILSGKGGTGKTSIAASLSLSCSHKSVLVDCDVEEPNAHLFLDYQLTHTVKQSKIIPVIDESKCDKCGKCAIHCKFNALSSFKTIPLVFDELCHSCGLCIKVCPKNAITETQQMIGQSNLYSKGSRVLVEGVLKIQEPMAAPLIRKTIEEAKTITCDSLIIDGPPGTSCSAISAAEQADFMLLVVEPTPFGIHDFLLTYDALKPFGKPMAMIINKQTEESQNQIQNLSQMDIPILAAIKGSKQTANQLSKGIPLIEIDDYQPLFQHIGSQIGEQLNLKW
jgi:MinD superfamily P-loop ATPase